MNFVDYRQSLDLKKLGFDYPVNHVYFNGILQEIFPERDCKQADFSPAPTLYEVYDWLITKGILVVVYSMSFESWQVRVCEKGRPFMDSRLYEDFSTSDEALSAGITVSLKMLLR